MYLAVRERGRRIREVAGKELEKKSAEAKKEGEEMGLFEAVQAMGDAADIATANLRAAQELKHNPKEYQWVEERVTAVLLAELSQRLNAQLAEGRDEYVQLLEAQRQAVADPARRAELERKIAEMRGRAETAAEPPGEALRHNVALVAKYRDRIRAVQTPEERFATGHGEELPGAPPTDRRAAGSRDRRAAGDRPRRALGAAPGLLADGRVGAARRAGVPLAGRRALAGRVRPRRRRRGGACAAPCPAGPGRSGATASCCRSATSTAGSTWAKGGRRSSALRRLRAGRASSVWVKDEAGNPTGSFKARGLSLAVNRARELGAPGVQLASAGNAALALTAYAAAAGLPARVALPADTPRTVFERCREHGAEVLSAPGTLVEAAKLLEAGEERVLDGLDLREPYRVEGKKTMGLELAEQLGWELPDWIVYPLGGGTGIVGMHKAFDELERLGLIGRARPRFVVVQMAGCAPIVRAFEAGEESAEPWEEPRTPVWGLRVPRAIGDFLVLRAVRETGGRALAVDEARLPEVTARLARRARAALGPEGAAALAALEDLAAAGELRGGAGGGVPDGGSGELRVRYR